MNFILFIKQSFSSLKANKLRSFLSTLWIIIWILSFVIMLSIWEWAKQSMMNNFGSAWNVIKVTKWDAGASKKTLKDVFTIEVSDEILQKVPNVKENLPIFNWLNWVKINYKVKPIYGNINLVAQNYFKFRNVKILLWTWFWTDDFEKKSKIAIIWYRLVRKTFWEENPIWKSINIGWQVFTVAWVLEEKWWDYDENIFIPYTTAKKYFWKAKIVWYEVQAESENFVEKVSADLKYFLMKKAVSEKFSDLNIDVRSNKEMMEMISEFEKTFSYFLTWIWSISLIVWWIWIMNIMLVSVTERTREVWIRKAIWASNLNIMMQFLVESIILTLIWSFLAILMAYWIISILNWFLVGLWMKIVINSTVLITAIIVSISMWIVFGLMPAYKAARLKVIDALHFE